MMKRILVLVAMLEMMVLSAALALSCDNVSRAAPKGDTSSSGPIIGVCVFRLLPETPASLH
jgi:hypothetical protein